MTWWDDAKPHALISVVMAELGIAGSTRHRWGCPACHAERDPAYKRRGAVGATSDRRAWVCSACHEQGGYLDLLAWALIGRPWRELGGEDKGALRAWCAARGWCAADPGAGPAPAPRPRPPPPPPEVPSYPDGVAEFWATCRPLSKAAMSRPWLDSRGFGARLAIVEDVDLARLATPGKDAPTWWPTWWGKYWRLAVQAWDIDGQLRSIHARTVQAEAPRDRDGSELEKVRWPAGHSATGLFFACPRAQRLLRGVPQEPLGALLLAEGLTDWLSAAAWAEERARLPGRRPVAVLGGVSGSWSALADLRPRLPEGLPVVVATDDDPKGDRYAHEVRAALGSVYRLRLGKGLQGKRRDLDDFLRDGGDLAAALRGALQGEERPGTRAEVLAWWAEHPDAKSTEVAERFHVRDDVARMWRRRAREADPPPSGSPRVSDPPPSGSPRVSDPPPSGSPRVSDPSPSGSPRVSDPPPARDNVDLSKAQAIVARISDLAGERGQRDAMNAEAVRLLEPEVVGSLALARRQGQQSDVGRLLLQVRGFRGLATVATEVEKAIKAENARSETESSTESPGNSLRELLGPNLYDKADLPEGLRVPPPWRVDKKGVWHLEETESGIVPHVVFDRPLLVVGLAEDEDRGDSWLSLKWWNGRCWILRDVVASQALHRQRIVDVPGLMVSTERAKNVVRFLDALRSENRHQLKEHAIAGRLGWRRDGFLLGDQLVGPDGPVTPAPALAADQAHLLRGYGARGTWEGWRAAVGLVAEHPRALLAVYASMIPPLLKMVPGAPNFIMDWAGTTSGGKTTSLRLAASVWGLPDDRGGGMIGTWLDSQVHVERRAAAICDLPLILDDTTKLQDKRRVQPIVFMVAQGQGAGRGTTTGTQRTVSFRTVLLSTGEAPCTSYARQGGAEMRSIVVWGPPLSEQSEAAAALSKRIERELLAHHGHLGPRWVRMLQQPGMEQRVVALADEGRRKWADVAQGSPLLGRLGDYGALLYVAHVLGGELGLPQNPQVFEVVGAAAERSAQAADKARLALEDAYEWAATRRSQFYDPPALGEASNARVPSEGWLGSWAGGECWTRIAFATQPLRRYLAELGYDVAGVLEAWRERGWLHVRPKGRSLTNSYRLGHGRITSPAEGYIVLREALEDVVGPAPVPTDSAAELPLDG